MEDPSRAQHRLARVDAGRPWLLSNQLVANGSGIAERAQPMPVRTSADRRGRSTEAVAGPWLRHASGALDAPAARQVDEVLGGQVADHLQPRGRGEDS
jgi:hypothetical protein